jgi:hypothetical protein
MLQSTCLTDVARCNPQPDSLFMNDLKTDLPSKVVFFKDGRGAPHRRQKPWVVLCGGLTFHNPLMDAATKNLLKEIHYLN